MTHSPATGAGISIRRATHDDDSQVLQLMSDTLGWRPEEPNEAFFNWKHRQSPFGESPAWVALDGERVVGYRTFMRWEFLGKDDRVVTAVRAVDTATAEGYRGRGIFRSLTLLAVGELTIEGVGIVFNTPNDQSRPGYLKMGWVGLGRVPVGVLPAGPRALKRMASARVPAQLMSLRTEAGVDASAALADLSVVSSLLAFAPRTGVRTRITPGFLRWRVGLAPLHYRLLLVDPEHPQRGGLLFRLRQRGEALEAVVAETLVANRRTMLVQCRRILRETGADYVLSARCGPGSALAPLPKVGPVLTTRALASSPPINERWRLSLGDVELF